MKHDLAAAENSPASRFLSHAPGELTHGRLVRLGEGVGKVVYASQNWVVKRDRSPSEILALIALWKSIRKIEHLLPGRLGERLLEKPSRQIRLLRVLVQGFTLVVPRGVWFASHIGEMWRVHRSRDERGEILARSRLAGEFLTPERIQFPPVRVKVGGWPGWLTVSEATERVEATLHQRLLDLARARRFEELESWLDRFLELRPEGWRRGVFSIDSHLKNFGVHENRIVLIDAGGLTDDWAEIESRLTFEEVVKEPHIQLGLGAALGARPDIADRFNKRWKALVNRSEVRRHWPANGS